MRLAGTARTQHFDSGELDLERGEHCIVETDRGPAYGLVSWPSFASRVYARHGRPLPKVVRRATFEDRQRHDQSGGMEGEAFAYCQRRIDDRHLPMKLVNVQQHLSEDRATFFFTSEGRVDFRALVKDLASRLRIRVEMRQIGVRDAARMLGGYGECGRPLCCSTWLPRFEPITIQMAKAQNLSLNPARISGMCGRLKCCLRYEYVPRDKPARRRRGGEPEKPAAPPHDPEPPATSPPDPGTSS